MHNKIRNSILTLVFFSIAIILASSISSELSEIERLLRSNSYPEAEQLIYNTIEQLDKESDEKIPAELYRAKLHYALSLCYYWDEEQKVIENLMIVNQSISLVEESKLVDFKAFVARLHRLYERLFEFTRNREYFFERAEYYLEIFELRTSIAVAANDIRLASRIKRQLIQFERILSDEDHLLKVEELHQRLDIVSMQMEPIPSIRD